MTKKTMARVERAEGLMRHELKSYFDLLPGSLLGNMLNACVIMFLFYNKVSPVIVISYGLLMTGMTTLRYLSVRRYRRETISADQLAGRIQTIRRYVGVLGFVWGGTIAWLITISSAAETAFLGMVAAGMMASGGIALASVKGAVRLYIGLVTGLTLCALLWVSTPLAYTSAALLVSFSIVLIRASIVNYNHFVIRHTRERELRESAQTVKLLLNDYQEQGSDWLWEVGMDGLLIEPSARFAQAAERPVETLDDQPMISLFDLCPEREILADHMTSFRPFRDAAVPLTIGGERRWWSLSGQPVESESGQMRLRGVATDISAIKNAEAKLAYMAHYDGLTDLPNRFLFVDTLNRALQRQRSGSYTAVLSIDLDHFKAVNDTLGHPAGDALLQVVSRRIESCLREKDIVARMGGDEFAILLPGTRGKNAAEKTASRILEALGQPIDLDGNQVVTTGSIGIVTSPGDGNSAETLMKHVDLALYGAKANGRNRYMVFEAEMDHLAQARRMVETDLRSALMRDELSLYYQPLINVESGETVAYEALLRWQHPTRGLVMPNDFIPIAEETGLIVQLGEWVIRNAVAEVARWPEHISVSVNLSPLQMKSGSLISTVINALAASNLEPQRLELEITETVLMHETEVNLATLHRLREVGVRIALDDFGTGYSSLNYLRSFPFDKIKIDRCFVEDVHNHGDSQAIIRAITGLATSLGMVTTAEGVENSEQLAQLRIEGCTEVQGFLFSKALPVSELTNLRSSTRLTAEFPSHAVRLPGAETSKPDSEEPAKRVRQKA
jgi:diguanylate cyclase (GGDEF)-like protein